MAKLRLTQEDVRRLALALPDSSEGAHMGHPDFRVGKKIFASLPPDGCTVALKIMPADLDLLVASDPATFRDVWGGRWLGVSLDRVTRPVLRRLLTESWRMTAPKSSASRRSGGASERREEGNVRRQVRGVRNRR
jgi:hypothetical protein